MANINSNYTCTILYIVQLYSCTLIVQLCNKNKDYLHAEFDVQTDENISAVKLS